MKSAGELLGNKEGQQEMKAGVTSSHPQRYIFNLKNHNQPPTKEPVLPPKSKQMGCWHVHVLLCVTLHSGFDGPCTPRSTKHTYQTDHSRSVL